MRLDAIPTGANPPDEVNVVVEVPLGGEPIKYELDKASGAMFVDRFLYTAMRYPGNYGFIPHTLSDDGDPCDVLVANTRPIAPGAVIAVRPIGVLRMKDEAGGDEKIDAHPASFADRFICTACGAGVVQHHRERREETARRERWKIFGQGASFRRKRLHRVRFPRSDRVIAGSCTPAPTTMFRGAIFRIYKDSVPLLPIIYGSTLIFTVRS